MDNMNSSTLQPEVQQLVTSCKGDIFGDLGFNKLKVLAKGTSGRVILSMPPHGSGPQVLKMFPKSEGRENAKRSRMVNKICFEAEVSTLAKIRHRNIIEMIQAYDSPDAYIISMPYHTEGDLLSLLPNLTSLQVDPIFLELTSAVHYLHSNHIAHRDIKPRNVLMSWRGSAILTDFGMAISLTSEQMAFPGFCGTRAYAAPEMRNARRNDMVNYYKGDMYMLGMILWCLKAKRKPKKDLVDPIAHLPIEVPNPGSDLYVLERILHYNADRRWDSTQLISHLWETWLPRGHHLCNYFGGSCEECEEFQCINPEDVYSEEDSGDSGDRLEDPGWSEEDVDPNTGHTHFHTQLWQLLRTINEQYMGTVIQPPMMSANQWPISQQPMAIPQHFVTTQFTVPPQQFLTYPHPSMTMPAYYPAPGL